MPQLATHAKVNTKRKTLKPAELFSFAAGIVPANLIHMKLCEWTLGSIFLIFISACGSTPAKQQDRAQQTRHIDAGSDAPDWVNNPYSEFPQDRYITAVGMGSNIDQSSSDARRAMAQGFRTQVRNEVKVNSGSTMNKDTAGKQAGNTAEVFSQNTFLISDAALRGADVKLNFKGKDGSVYTLVAIDKLQARAGVLQDLQRLELKMNSTLDQMELKTKPTLAKYKEFQGLLEGYEILLGEASALGVATSDRAQRIESRGLVLLEKWRARFQNERIVVEVKSGPASSGIRLEECLSDAGIPINPKDPTSRILLSLQDRPEHMNIEGWVRIKADLSAEIFQKDSKKSIMVSGIETSRNQEAAMDILVENLTKQICQKVLEQF